MSNIFHSIVSRNMTAGMEELERAEEYPETIAAFRGIDASLNNYKMTLNKILEDKLHPEAKESLLREFMKTEELWTRFKKEFHCHPNTEDTDFVSMIFRSNKESQKAVQQDLAETREQLSQAKKDLLENKKDLDRYKEDLQRAEASLRRTQELLTETTEKFRKAEDNFNRQRQDYELEIRKQNEEASNLRLANMQLSTKMKILSDQTKADKNLLRTDIERLESRIDKLNGELSNQSCELMLSSKKDQDIIEKQILGDFAYQFQKFLAQIMKSSKKALTPGQMAYQMQYEALSPQQRSNLDTAKLSDMKTFKKLEIDISILKELRFSTAHYALSNKVFMNLDDIEKLANKHQVLDCFRDLRAHWKNLSVGAGTESENVFEEELYLSSKYN